MNWCEESIFTFALGLLGWLIVTAINWIPMKIVFRERVKYKMGAKKKITKDEAKMKVEKEGVYNPKFYNLFN